jgi:hypothetical protein
VPTAPSFEKVLENGPKARSARWNCFWLTASFNRRSPLMVIRLIHPLLKSQYLSNGVPMGYGHYLSFNFFGLALTLGDC